VNPEGNHASTQRVSLIVGKPATPVVSNLTLVRSVETVTAPRDPANPLELNGARITPDLLQTVARDRGAMLFFVAYPEPARAEGSLQKPSILIQYVQNGKEVA
jgi:hypothetical protein